MTMAYKKLYKNVDWKDFNIYIQEMVRRIENMNFEIKLNDFSSKNIKILLKKIELPVLIAKTILNKVIQLIKLCLLYKN